MENLVFDLLLVLFAGLVAGAVCRRLGVSLLVGYLVVGTVIGPGLLGLVSAERHELKHFAEAGALLLLFSIGIEFSLGELRRMARHLFIGGAVQMALVTAAAAGASWVMGAPWRTCVLVGAAAALSSTVLVFKALEEYGQVATRHGRRAVAVLLFQDFALVPLMLLVPVLVGSDQQPTVQAWLLLALKSALFIAVLVVARHAFGRWGVPLLSALRSPELVVLFTLVVLAGSSGGALLADRAALRSPRVWASSPRRTSASLVAALHSC